MRTGVDFSTYRQPTVERRIRNRMMSLGIASLIDYLELLSVCRTEPLRLIERVTIKTSRFYRHAPTFDCLRKRVLGELAELRQGAPVRIWSVGTGAGEEAYTLAMLLEEAGIAGTVEASDIDHSACDAGRAGLYPASAIEELPPELAKRFLEPTALAWRSRYRVTGALRERVRFSIYDITRPGLAPGEGCFDLIMCRNLLIYLQFATQEQVLRHLRSALSEWGHLCLGEAEWPTVGICATLKPLSHRTRIFRAIDAPRCEAPP